MQINSSVLKIKEKERKSIYIAPFCTKVHTKRSGMDHTVLPANNTMPVGNHTAVALFWGHVVVAEYQNCRYKFNSHPIHFRQPWASSGAPSHAELPQEWNSANGEFRSFRWIWTTDWQTQTVGILILSSFSRSNSNHCLAGPKCQIPYRLIQHKGDNIHCTC